MEKLLSTWATALTPLNRMRIQDSRSLAQLASRWSGFACKHNVWPKVTGQEGWRSWDACYLPSGTMSQDSFLAAHTLADSLCWQPMWEQERDPFLPCHSRCICFQENGLGMARCGKGLSQNTNLYVGDQRLQINEALWVKKVLHQFVIPDLMTEKNRITSWKSLQIEDVIRFLSWDLISTKYDFMKT